MYNNCSINHSSAARPQGANVLSQDEIFSIENSVKSYLMNARHHFDEGDYKRAIAFVDLAINETEYLVKHNAAEQGLHPTSGSLRGLLASFWLRFLSAIKHFTSPPTCG
jgi:hypothetical protein